MDQYQKLERKFVQYKNLLNIKVRENKERLVTIDNRCLKFGYLKGMDDMKKLIGNKIFVRETVLKKLILAQRNLTQKNPNLILYLTYGFRDLSIQKRRFLKRLKVLAEEYFEDPLDLYEAVHRSVAVPSVAGHPTGGAVDITLYDKKRRQFLDFGSKQYDYTNKNAYVFIKGISQIAKEDRKFLRDCLLKTGFAPYDAEWWHFSYGDREWAFYFKKAYALYGQLSLEDVKRNI